jgi:hypothetical protein
MLLIRCLMDGFGTQPSKTQGIKKLIALFPVSVSRNFYKPRENQPVHHAMKTIPGIKIFSGVLLDLLYNFLLLY